MIVVRGKGGKTRTIPLNAGAQALLERLPRHGVFDVPYRDSVSVLRRVTETVKRQTGIPFHLHLLRHAFASRLLAAGVDIVTVSSLLGHGARMTTLLFAHSSIDQMRKAVDTLPGHRAMNVSPESRLRS